MPNKSVPPPPAAEQLALLFVERKEPAMTNTDNTRRRGDVLLYLPPEKREKLQELNDWIVANCEPVEWDDEQMETMRHEYGAYVQDALQGEIYTHSLWRFAWERYHYLPGGPLNMKDVMFSKPRCLVPNWLREILYIPPAIVTTPLPIPDVFETGSAKILSTLAVQGAAKAIYCRPTAETPDKETGGWKMEANGWPSITISTLENPKYIDVYLRYSDERELTQKDRDALWQHARDLSELTSDIFLMIIAQAVDHIDNNRQTEDGLIWITVDQALHYRGIGRRRKDGYNAGFKPEYVADIAQCMNQVSHMWVRMRGVDYYESDSSNPQKKILKPLPDEFKRGRLLAIMAEKGKESLDGTMITTAWGFTLGAPLTIFLSHNNRMVTRIAKKVLEYHLKDKLWERRLAKYIMIQMRADAKNGHQFHRSVGVLLDEIKVKIDTGHPERTLTRLEEALNCLVQDGIIGRWYYAYEYKELPARNWLKDWLPRQLVIELPLASETATTHALIAQRAQAYRSPQQGAAAAPTRKRGRPPKTAEGVEQ